MCGPPLNVASCWSALSLLLCLFKSCSPSESQSLFSLPGFLQSQRDRVVSPPDLYSRVCWFLWPGSACRVFPTAVSKSCLTVSSTFNASYLSCHLGWAESCWRAESVWTSLVGSVVRPWPAWTPGPAAACHPRSALYLPCDLRKV